MPRPSRSSGIRRIVVELREEEHNELAKLKGNLTWRDFIFDLVDFKRKMEQEGEFVPRDSLKEPYVMQAQALRKLGSLLKVVWKDEKGEEYKEGWELEAAALLPLYVSGVELNEEEKRMLLLLITSVLEKLMNRYHPDLADEVKWIVQGLRMLAINKKRAYDLSMDNFIEERSRRQGTSSD